MCTYRFALLSRAGCREDARFFYEKAQSCKTSVGTIHATSSAYRRLFAHWCLKNAHECVYAVIDGVRHLPCRAFGLPRCRALLPRKHFLHRVRALE